jgi:DNA-binding transcriptional LysR family regulator
VLQGEIDMAVLPTPLSHPRLKSIALCSDPVVLVCSPELKATLPDPLPLDQLSQVSMISFQTPSRFRTFVDSILEQHGVYPNVTMEFDSHEAVRMMVAMGFGVAMVPKSAVEGDLDSGKLVPLTVDGLQEITRTTSLVVKRENASSQPAAANLLHMILEHYGVSEV